MFRETLILGLAIALQSHPAQAPEAAATQQSFKLSVTADLVLLDVSIKTANGESVPGLTKDNFRVYEDGKLQTVSHFASEDVPVTAGLVIDMSGSMRAKRQEVVTAALGFIGASNRSDEIFVVHFSDAVSLGLPPHVPFSDDLDQLRAALSMGIPQGRTALNDAILLSLRHLEQGKRDRRALVLVSDGGDNSSTHRAEDVMRAVLESRATIYTIGLFDESDPDRNPGFLRRLALISGGESFLEVGLPAVVGVCRQIAGDIRTRYTLGYVPVRASEAGESRTIKVTASLPGGHKLVVHTRSHYVLPPAGAPTNPNVRASRKGSL